MKKIFLFFLLILILVLGFLNYGYLHKKNPRAIINSQVFNLEIAKTEKEKEIGLAKYKTIPQSFGILFVFEKPAYYSFWMKNMKFPIDIIFIKDKKIVTIFSNVDYQKSDIEQLPVYRPKVPSDTVLEINAGLARKYNFQENQFVDIIY